MNGLRASLVVLCFLLPSCLSKPLVVPVLAEKPKSVHTPNTVIYPLVTLQDSVYLEDIAFFGATRPYMLENAAGPRSILKYNATATMSDICAFYRAEMDFAGWEEGTIIQSVESCLIFDKPGKRCTVIIKPLETSLLELTLFIELKRYTKKGP